MRPSVTGGSINPNTVAALPIRIGRRRTGMAVRPAATLWPIARPPPDRLSARRALLARRALRPVTARVRLALRPVTAPARTPAAALLEWEGIASDSVMSRAGVLEEIPRSAAVPTGLAVRVRARTAAAARPVSAEVASVAAAAVASVAAAAASEVAAAGVAAGAGER